MHLNEKMKVTSVSIPDNFFSKKGEKDLIKNAKKMLKDSVKRALTNEKDFNSLALLISPNKLYLCEICEVFPQEKKKYSLIGKYAKKYGCSAAVFAEKQKRKGKDILLFISIAYNERLVFSGGKDTLEDTYVIVKNYNGKFDRLEKISNSSARVRRNEITNIINHIRKPLTRLVSTNKVYVN
ncbi:MAG: hypothetical protein M0R03_16690 [Novosphingobium sp.]|nr:hypothetical protein [Novosphingobium sp.]